MTYTNALVNGIRLTMYNNNDTLIGHFKGYIAFAAGVFILPFALVSDLIRGRNA
jgi:hypothetical protein